MGFVFQFIQKLIKFAIVLGLSGGLVRATAWIYKETIQTKQTGLISLQGWNNQLEKRHTTTRF